MKKQFTNGKFKTYEQTEGVITINAGTSNEYEFKNNWIQSESGRLIGEVYYSNKLIGAGLGAVDSLEEMEANARLFVNAPEMFEVLMELLGEIEDQEMYLKAEKVIAKILGE